MSSVGLRDIPRTTSFRLALLFLGLFGAASLMLFGFLYWRTAGYLATAVDDWLLRESTVRAAERPKDLRRDLADRPTVDPDGQRPIALFDAEGNWLVGNRAILPTPSPSPDQPFDLTLPRGGVAAPFRGIAHRLPSGEVLLVARDMRDIHHFRDLLIGAMASGGLVVLVLGLAGAAITGAGALGRIDKVTKAIERIVNGDLSERLPSGGTAGDLDRLIDVVNRMLDDIERLMSEVKGVTENIAHDLRTPLTRLVAGLERARRRATTTTEFSVAVDEAIVETKGVLATFGALLRIAEVEAGARRAGFMTMNLATVAADVAELYEPVAESKGIALSLRTERGIAVEMAGDPSLLFEAIGNLVDNAIKFTPPGGQVSLRTYSSHRRLAIEVSDTGPGIAVTERAAVLRRFHRTEKSRNTPGCGLGLSLVAAVARLHGLHLEIQDANPGCRVTLWRDSLTVVSPPWAPSGHVTVPAANSDVVVARSLTRVAGES
jgi:signal transduction histidine kinase